MTIFIEPSTSNRPRTRSQTSKSFLEVVADVQPGALTAKGRAAVEDARTELKRRKAKTRCVDPVKNIYDLVDKNKFNIPEGDYIEICRSLRRLHMRSAPGFVKCIKKAVLRIVSVATVPFLILRSILKGKKGNVIPNEPPTGILV